MKRTVKTDRAFDKRNRRPIEVAVPDRLRARWRDTMEPDCRAYRMGHCTVFLGTIPGQGLHMSIAHPTRYPSWDEVADARYALIPDEVTMAMVLPPSAQYVNLHPNCFHLHQLK
jgi:hypothetical protein